VEIESRVNEIIGCHLLVSEEFLPTSVAAEIVDLSKLPDDVSETLRIVRVGDYDVCACIGSHVENTSEIGRFEIISHDFIDGRWRVRFKLR
jgi:alanyl-tRNA synthetase